MWADNSKYSVGSGSSSLEPYRVAFMLPRLSRYGGAERFAWNLARYIASFPDYEVHFICARQESEAPENVRVRVVGRKGGLKSIKILWFAFAAEMERRKGMFDLSFSLGKTWNQDILRLSGGPLPVFWRLSRQAYSPGWSRRWKMFKRRISPANHLINLIERRQMRCSKNFVAVSHKLVDWICEAYPEFARESVHIIYNKPQLDSFKPFAFEQKKILRTQFGLPQTQVYIGTAGTNFALKGIGCLIRALPYLPEDHHLLVAGGRSPGRYKKLAKILGVGGRVHFLGRVRDMAAFYNCCDVFVLASFYDACSNAVLEALSCGVPVLSTANNGSSYFLHPHNVLADPKDYTTLASSIQRLVEKEYEGFHWPESIQAGLNHYKDLIDSVLEKG